MAGKGRVLLISVLAVLGLQASVLAADVTYRVCIGSFSGRQNADRTAEAFRKSGLSARIETSVVNGALRYRVQTEASYTNAAQVAEECRRIAYTDTALALGIGYPWYTETPKDEYAVCLGSFLMEQNAAVFARALYLKGISTVTRNAVVDNRTWYRVIAARTYDAAASALEDAGKMRRKGIVRNAGGGDPWVMRNGVPFLGAFTQAIPLVSRDVTGIVPVNVAQPALTNAAPVFYLPGVDTNPTVVLVTNSVRVETNSVTFHPETAGGTLGGNTGGTQTPATNLVPVGQETNVLQLPQASATNGRASPPDFGTNTLPIVADTNAVPSGASRTNTGGGQ